MMREEEVPRRFVVGTEHVIVGQEVLISEVLGGLSVVSDGCRVGPYSRTSMTLLKEMDCSPYQRNLCGPKSAS